MNILTKMSEMNGLTSNEKILAEYMVKNPREVINYKPQELAEKAFVSVATIYRLINKLKLNGLGELKVEIASTFKMSGNQAEINYNYPILESDTPFQLSQNMHKLYQQTLSETTNFFDPEALDRVCNLLLKAKTIDVYTASANVYFAQNFKFQMQEIGVLLNVPEEDYIQHLSAANSNPDHVAIVISYGGRGGTTREVVEILTENKVPIVLITSIQENPLVHYATEKLYLASVEDHYNKISSFSTRLSLLSVLDTLYALYFNKNNEANIRFKMENYKKMNKEVR